MEDEKEIIEGNGELSRNYEEEVKEWYGKKRNRYICSSRKY